MSRENIERTTHVARSGEARVEEKPAEPKQPPAAGKAIEVKKEKDDADHA
jgi:hypothetical protein